jgi:hypothetical protein
MIMTRMWTFARSWWRDMIGASGRGCALRRRVLRRAARRDGRADRWIAATTRPETQAAEPQRGRAGVLQHRPPSMGAEGRAPTTTARTRPGSARAGALATDRRIVAAFDGAWNISPAVQMSTVSA